jgi:hypothetical protein
MVGSASEGKQKSDGDDEPSQLSLADRVRLFNQKIQDDSRTPAVEKVLPPTRKRLSQASRFKTQPVTTEEVETATRRISPLAASLTKPPDPKVLGATVWFIQYLEVQSCHADSVAISMKWLLEVNKSYGSGNLKVAEKSLLFDKYPQHTFL